jgi:hypothetical protein
MILTMFISMVLEKKTFYLVGEQKRLFWSISSAGPEARLLILKNASQINRFTYLIYAISAAWSIVLLPVFGSHKEWLLTEYVFDRYFGSSSQILYHLAFFFLHLSLFTHQFVTVAACFTTYCSCICKCF